MPVQYLPIGLTLLIGIGFALFLTGAAKFLGPSRRTKAKDYPYECGSEVIGNPRAPFSIKFYQVAILFLVFDIEVAFLYPWALRFRELSCVGPVVDGVCQGQVSFFGLAEVLVFMGLLIVALVYVWRKRAVGWE